MTKKRAFLLFSLFLLLAVSFLLCRGYLVFIWSKINRPRYEALFHQMEKASTWQECEQNSQAQEKIPYCVGNLSRFHCSTQTSSYTSNFVRCLGFAAQNSNNPEICFNSEILDSAIRKWSGNRAAGRDVVRIFCTAGWLGQKELDPRLKENKNITKAQEKEVYKRLCQEMESNEEYKRMACDRAQVLAKEND